MSTLQTANGALPPPPPEDTEDTEDTKEMGRGSAMLVLSFLKKHQLKEAEEKFKKDAQISDDDVYSFNSFKGPVDDVQSALSSYANNEDPDFPDEYTEAYNQLKQFVDGSLDRYKFEVGTILWPVFVHMYLELVYNEHKTQASTFFGNFSKIQERFHESDLVVLGSIMKKYHLLNSENPFRAFSSCLTSRPGSQKSGSTGLYVVRMSSEAFSVLNRFLQERRVKLVQNIVQDRICLEVYDGTPRGKNAINAVSGHFMGEALRQDNKAKVYYGLLKEPDLRNVRTVDEDDDESAAADSQPAEGAASAGSSNPAAATPGSGGGGDKRSLKNIKKKKIKKNWLTNKKSKNDPNAPPPFARMPLPEWRDIDKIEKVKALREAAEGVQLGTDRLPSVCMYTIVNGDYQVSCIKWSDDGTLLAAGFGSSTIQVWSITNQKLKMLKKASDLTEIDRKSNDVLARMIDERTGEPFRYLRGHSGPVYSVEFSFDKSNLLSSSEDCSIRLWSLLTWTCLVVYKGHLFPVWKAVFSPHGCYYFASCGHDKTARLWSTDNTQCLRIFSGHYSDVTTVEFHPNSHYIASGGADRSVRLWDNVSGNCVRLMTGHKGSIQALKFSNDGRFLASGAMDGKVIVWDLSNGSLLSVLARHEGPVYALSFSREGNLLATAGRDCLVRLWNFAGITKDIVAEVGGSGTPALAKESSKLNGSEYFICEFLSTNQVPIYSLHFTRRNILLVSGPVNQ